MTVGIPTRVLRFLVFDVAGMPATAPDVARDLGATEAAVRRALHELEAAGLVERATFALRGARVGRPPVFFRAAVTRAAPRSGAA